MIRKTLVVATLLGLSFWSQANAGFIVEVDADDLTYTGGPGQHDVDLFVKHDGSGSNTLDGLQIDITNAPNARVQQGNTPTSFAGTPFLSSNINTGNRYAIGDIASFEVPSDPLQQLLTTLTFNVTNDQPFTIGLEFVTATRSFAPIADSFDVPSSFTVSTIPEPSSIIYLGLSVALMGGRRRRQRSRKRGR